ncbi:hypothetical protein VTH82DRAFT_6618 [Thermothelomyces myriococcoides]
MRGKRGTQVPGIEQTTARVPTERLGSALSLNLYPNTKTLKLILLWNILPASTAAPGLLANQKRLERHMRADSLNEKIAHRPSPEALIRDGVLREDPRSPSDKYAEAIEEEYAKRGGGA